MKTLRDEEVKCVNVLPSRQAERGEEGDVSTTIHQPNIDEQSPEGKKEGPGESDSSSSPPKVPEPIEDEGKEADDDEIKPQLSSSVTIDMADVHSSLELSTIAGVSGVCGAVGVFKRNQGFHWARLQPWNRMDVSILVPCLHSPFKSYILFKLPTKSNFISVQALFLFRSTQQVNQIGTLF